LSPLTSGEQLKAQGLVPLNNFFSRTTLPISTKLGWNHDWGMGIQICSNNGAGPFWGLIRGKELNLQKSSSRDHWPECIDIWHGTSLGQAYSNLFK